MILYFLLYLYVCILGLSNKASEIPLPNFNTPTTYDELRARNRQEYERAQPNKPIYRYIIIIYIFNFLIVILRLMINS